jgi:hypothetical protein
MKTYIVIYKDWTFRENLISITEDNSPEIMYFIECEIYGKSTTGLVDYYKYRILNTDGIETTIKVGNFELDFDKAEHWIKYNEISNEYIGGVKAKFVFFYGNSHYLAYKYNGIGSISEKNIPAPTSYYSMVGLSTADIQELNLSTLVNRGSKGCSIRLKTNSDNITIGLLSAYQKVTKHLVKFCKSLASYDNCHELIASELSFFIKGKLLKLDNNFVTFDKNAAKFNYDLLVKFANGFKEYIVSMKNKGVDIDKYLKLLETKL